jgi:Adenylate cyclase associated (CAP) C terminal
MNGRRVTEVKGLVDETQSVEVCMGHSVYMSNMKQSLVHISGKPAKISVIECEGSTVCVERMLGNIEAMRLQGCDIIIKEGNMINVEECRECRICVFNQDCEIRVARHSNISLFLASSEGDLPRNREGAEYLFNVSKELYVPEEIKVTLVSEELCAEVVKRE